MLEPLETRSLWGDIDIERIAPPTWTATAEARRSRHRTTGFCPTKLAPYGPKDPFGELVGDACRVTGCFDIYHDLLTGVVTKVLRHTESHPHQPIANLAGFVSSVARSELTELQRAERTRRGRPAKPTRNDGVGGRINSVLKRDPVIGEWLEVLFRIMRAYPFSPHHVCGTWDHVVVGRQDEPRHAGSSGVTAHLQEVGRAVEVLRLSRDGPLALDATDQDDARLPH